VEYLARGMRISQPENAMLRITVHQDDDRYRLELAGKLGGPWVAETENVWRSAPCSGGEIELDMREVTGIDDAGRELLIAMHEAGAHFVAQGVAMTALIEDITGKQPLDGAKRRRRVKEPSPGSRFPDQQRK
jgi:hypothetical protein